MFLKHSIFYAAEGGAGSETAIAQPTQQSSHAVQTGGADVQQTGQAPQNAPVAQAQQNTESFEDLIAGRYKADYEKRVKAAVNERLKGTKKTIQRFTPIMDVLGQRYGMDTADMEKVDFEALAQKLTEDKSFYEQEALERGIPVEELTERKRLELENTALRRTNAQALEEQRNREGFERLRQQFEEVRATYPGADLGMELENENFGRLVANGVPARTAYEVIHMQELDQIKARAAAQVATQQAVASIQANGLRPQEGGTGTNQTPITFDPTKLTRQQREDIRKRVRRGERIVL